MAIKMTAKPKVVMFNQMNWQLMPPTNEVKTIPKPTTTTTTLQNSIPTRESTKIVEKIGTITDKSEVADNEKEDDDDNYDADLFHDFQEGDISNDNEGVDQLNHDHIIRTIHFCCPLPDCPLIIPFNTNLHAANSINELIDAHMRQVHGCSRMPFMLCLDCWLSYPTVQLDQHLAQHHPAGKNFKCSKCEAAFKTYDNLVGHNDLVHVKGCFECKKHHCTFIAPYRSAVYEHYHEQHWFENRCAFEGCGRKFKTRSWLKRHNLQHLGVTMFRCTIRNCRYAGSNDRASIFKHIWENHTHEQMRDVVATDVEFPHPSLFVKEITFCQAMQDAGKFDFEI